MSRLTRLAITAGAVAAVAGPGAAVAGAKVTVTPQNAKAKTVVTAVVSKKTNIAIGYANGYSLDAELIAPAGASERCGVHHPPSGRFSSNGSKAVFKLDPGDALYGGKWCKGTWKAKLSVRTETFSSDDNPTDDGWVHLPLVTISFKVK
jgi:hypothetical protein